METLFVGRSRTSTPPFALIVYTLCWTLISFLLDNLSCFPIGSPSRPCFWGVDTQNDGPSFRKNATLYQRRPNHREGDRLPRTRKRRYGRSAPQDPRDAT